LGGGGIIGFSPGSPKKTILLYKKKNHFNEWEFVYDPAQDQMLQIGGGSNGLQQSGNMPGSNGLGSSPGGFGSSPGGFGSSPGGFGNSPGGFGSSPGGLGNSGNSNSGSGSSDSGSSGSGSTSGSSDSGSNPSSPPQ
jgi:hypothetical protein